MASLVHPQIRFEVDDIIKKLSAELKKRIETKFLEFDVTCISCIDSDLLIGDSQGCVYLMNGEDLAIKCLGSAHNGVVSQIVVGSKENNEFFTSGDDNTIVFWVKFEPLYMHECEYRISWMYWDSNYIWVVNNSELIYMLEVNNEGFYGTRDYSIYKKGEKITEICVFNGKKTVLFYCQGYLNFRYIQEDFEILHIKTEEVTALAYISDINSIVYAEKKSDIKVVNCQNKQSSVLPYSNGVWSFLKIFESNVLVSGGEGTKKERFCCKFWNLEEMTYIMYLSFQAAPIFFSESLSGDFFYLSTDSKTVIKVQKKEKYIITRKSLSQDIKNMCVVNTELLVSCGDSLKLINDSSEETIYTSIKNINLLAYANNKITWESEGKVSYMDLADRSIKPDVYACKSQVTFLSFGNSENSLLLIKKAGLSYTIIAFDLVKSSEITSIYLEESKMHQAIWIENMIIYATDDGITLHNTRDPQNPIIVKTFARTNLKFCLNLKKTFLFCAGDNEIIDVISLNWSIDEKEIVNFSISSSFSTELQKKNIGLIMGFYKSISSISLSITEKFLMIGKEDSVQFWNIKDEALVWKYKLKGKIDIKILVNNYFIFFAMKNEIVVLNDPSFIIETNTKTGILGNWFRTMSLGNQKISLLGPNSSSLYFLAAVEGISRKWIRTKYDQRIYRWVVFPSCINFLHLSVHLMNQGLIEKAFDLGCPFLRMVNGKSPLTIALENKNKEIIEMVLGKINEQAEINSKILSCIESDLPKVNQISPPSLSKIYKLAFPITSQKGLRNYGNLLNSTGVIITNPSYLIDENNFLAKKIDTLEEISIVYRVSSFRMNFATGSLDGIRFLDSLTNCTDSEVFKTQLVKAIILYKWHEIQYAVVIYSIITLLFSLYNLYYVGFLAKFSYLGTIAVFIMNSMFLIHEILQILIGKKSYVKNLWNLIDITRIITCYFFLYYKFKCFAGYEMFYFEPGDRMIYQSIVIVLVLLTLLRCLSFFELFDSTRSMIKVFRDVIKDSLVFLIVLAMTTFSFTFIFMILNKDLNLMEAFTSTYSINFGNFNLDVYSKSAETGTFYMILFCFHLATLINPLLMINLLVSIMNDTFGRLKDNLQAEDLKALAELITESESILIWKRDSEDREYIQICSQESIDESTDEKRLKKVSKLRNRISNIKEEVEKINQDAKKTFDSYDKFIADNRKQETELFERLNKEETYLRIILKRSNTLTPSRININP